MNISEECAPAEAGVCRGIERSLDFIQETTRLWGRSQTTLKTFCPFLSPYLPTVDICEEIPPLLLRENLHSVDISSTPTYLVLST